MTMQELGATTGTWIGVIVALLTLRPVLGKQLDEYRHRHRTRLRTEAEFALKLAQASGKPEHAKLAEQLGLSALLGDADLTVSERHRLLALKDPVFWANQYDRCKDLVAIKPEGSAPFGWRKASHQSAEGRKNFRSLAFAGYFAFVLIAFLPGYFAPHMNQQTKEECVQPPSPPSSQPAASEPRKQSSPMSMAIALMVWLILMLSAAVYCLAQTMKLNDAEKLIQRAEAGEQAGVEVTEGGAPSC
jgi:hypothetical protein